MKRTTTHTLCHLIWLIALLAVAGCSSSKKALQHGDYYGATMKAVEHLRKSPNSKKSIDVLRQAYPLAKENGLRKVRNAMETGRAGKYIIAADEYLMLAQLADAIYTCPKALEIFPAPEQYGSELKEILPRAAEEAYTEGEQQMSLKTIAAAREAFRYFVKAKRYAPTYRDIDERIDEALWMATLKVVVQKPVTPRNFQYSADFFYDNLMAEISRMVQDRFVRFYTYEEAKRERLNRPDQYLVLDFNDFTVGNMRESRNTSEVKRDSVKTGTTTVNGVSYPVYGTVKAELITFRREVISQGTLTTRIVDAANDRIEQHRNFPGRYVWYNEWATYRGDKRALNDHQLRMAQSEAIMPPGGQELFIEFTRPIFDQTVRFVRDYYLRNSEAIRTIMGSESISTSLRQSYRR